MCVDVADAFKYTETVLLQQDGGFQNSYLWAERPSSLVESTEAIEITNEVVNGSPDKPEGLEGITGDEES